MGFWHRLNPIFWARIGDFTPEQWMDEYGYPQDPPRPQPVVRAVTPVIEWSAETGLRVTYR